MQTELQHLHLQKKIERLWDQNSQLEARIQELNLRLNMAERVLIEYGEDPALLYRQQQQQQKYVKPKRHFMDYIFSGLFH